MGPNEMDEEFPTQKLNANIVTLFIATTIQASGLSDLNVELAYNDNKADNFSVIITRKNHYYFPQVFVTSAQNNQGKHHKHPSDELETTSEKSQTNVVCYPVRIVIAGCSLRASFQIFGDEKEFLPHCITWNVDTSTWKVSEELLLLLNYVSETGKCRICEGISPEEALISGEITVKCSSLVAKTRPFVRLEAPNCSYIKPNQNKTSKKCQECLKWVSNMKNYRKRKEVIQLKSNKKPEIDKSSRTKISSLSPQNYKKRLLNLRRDRVLEAKLAKHVTLNKTQNK